MKYVLSYNNFNVCLPWVADYFTGFLLNVTLTETEKTEQSGNELYDNNDDDIDDDNDDDDGYDDEHEQISRHMNIDVIFEMHLTKPLSHQSVCDAVFGSLY